MTTTRQASESVPSDRIQERGTKKRVEFAALVVSLTVLALLAATDVVRSAPPDASIVQATFDVAPPIEATPSSERLVGWAADRSAKGTRPGEAH